MTVHTEQLSGLQVLSEQRNGLSSTTGFLRFNSGPPGVTYYYKTQARNLASEARMLAIANEASRGLEGIAPTRLISYLLDSDMLITEHVEHYQKAFNWVWNGSAWLRWRQRKNSLTPEMFGGRLGRWLRAFHQATSSPGADWQEIVRDTLERALEKCQAVERLPRHLPFYALLGRAHKQLESWLRDYASWPAGPMGNVHGDFTLMNAGVKEDGNIVIFDFGDARRACLLEDVVRVWHDLCVIGRTSGGRFRFTRRCTRALLDAYGPEYFGQNREMVNCLSLWNALINFHVLGFGSEYMSRMGRLASLWSRKLMRAYTEATAEILNDCG